MKSSIQVQNEIRECDNRIDELSAKFNAADGDIQAAIHDEICEAKGEKKALYAQLPDIQAYEDSIRQQGGVPLAAAEDEKPQAKAVHTVVDALMKDFDGLSFGDKLSYDIKNAGSDLPYTKTGLTGVTETDYNVPRLSSDAAFQFGFLESLPKATTAADVLKFFVKDKLTNNAAVWTEGSAKPSSVMGWTEETVNIDTLAHVIPVLEQQLKDSGQFEDVLNTELLVGLKMAESAYAYNKVVSNANIQTYTKGASDDVVDAIRKMRTNVMVESGFVATHVAMHPYVAESLELMKDKNGRYIQQVINGKLWALNVVEDINLTTAASGKETAATYGAIVYWNGAGTWFTKETDSVSVGLVGNQFIYNEATLRAEGRHALKVAYPKAFAYLADTGVTR